MEYYQGILFLTTNRVGKIDEAFRSRVHVSLYYPPLKKKPTVDIFKTNLERVKAQRGDALRIKDEEIKDFAKAHYKNLEPHVRWNGRQIRNAFHIAVALAENEAGRKSSAKGEGKKKPTLRERHFRMVENASTKFDDYLTSVLGMGQSQRARQKEYRQDTWEDESYSRERSGNRRGRNKGRKRQSVVETDDTDADTTDDTEDGGDDEEGSESDDSDDQRSRVDRCT